MSADTLVAALRQKEPLARLVIDAHLDGWGQRLDYPEGQLAAMRSGARLIAATLPPSAVDPIGEVAARLNRVGRAYALDHRCP